MASAEDILPIIRQAEGNPTSNTVSKADPRGGTGGAIGIHAITPGTATAYGFDPARLKEDEYNTTAAKFIVSDLNTKNKGDLKSVLIGYNGGQGLTNKWMAAGKNDAMLPPQTQEYIKRAGLPLTKVAASENGLALPLADRIAKARASGFTWDEINVFMADRRAIAKSKGFSDQEIDAAMGYTDPAPMVQRLQDAADMNVRASTPPEPQQAGLQKPAVGLIENFRAGVQRSSDSLITYGNRADFIERQDASYAEHLAALAGETIGDIPQMVMGAIAAAPVGPVAQGAAAMALPAFTKAEYANALKNGQAKDAADFAQQQAAVLWKTAKAGSVGALTAATGGLAVGAAEAAGLGTLGITAAEKSAQLATMVAVSKGIEGQLPAAMDWADGALTLGAFHASLAVAAKAPAVVQTIKSNIMDHWVKTGETPKETVSRAKTDPVFHQMMVSNPDPQVPEGSSTTKTSEGDFVLPKINALSIADEHATEVMQLETDAMKAMAKKTEPTDGDPWSSVGSRIADEPTGKGWAEKAKDFVYEAYTSLFNPQHPINKITKAMREGGTLTDANNPDFVSRIAENHGTRAMYALETAAADISGKKVGPSLNEILGRQELPGKPFLIYATARWALEKATQEKETGVHLDDAKRVVAEGGKHYEKSFQDLVKFQNTTLGWLRDSGIISEKAHDAMVAENGARIPGYREGKQARPVPGAPGGGKAVRNPVKEFLGSERKILPIATSIMRDTFLRAALADRAYANRMAADGAETVGLAVKVGEEVAPKLAVDAWMDGDEHPAEDLDEALTKLAGQHLKAEEVPVPRDGNIERWVFSDPNVARVLRGFDRSDLSLLQKMARPFANFQRAMITLNPLFAPKVLWYDVQFQFLTKPGLRNTPADLVAGMRDVVSATPEDAAKYDAWVREGGADHVFEWAGQNAYIKDYLAGKADPTPWSRAWNAIKTPVDALQAWNRGWFSVMRAGRFTRGVQQGESDAAAGFNASEAAFHRANWGGPQAKALNAVQPFFAAYLNGLEQTFKAYTGRNFVGDQMLSGGDVALNWGKAITTVTTVALSNWWLNKDEDWYKAAPDWQKDNGIFVGSNATGHMWLPFPPLIGFIFGAIPRRTIDAYALHNPRAFDNLGKGAAASFAPPAGLFTMSVMEPVIEHVANYSFFKGRPIQSDAQLKMLPQERAIAYTTETARQIGSILNVPPVITDNYLQEWGGTLGIAAVRYTEMALGANKKAPTPAWSDLPLFSSFAVRYPSATAQPIMDFEDKLDQMEQLHASMTAVYKTGDLARFQELAKKNPTAALMSQFGIRNAAPPENPQAYGDALKAAKVYVNMPAMRELAVQEAALKYQRQSAANVANADPKKMNGNDRRQALDNIYRAMQASAEKGLKAMDGINGDKTP